MPPSPVYKVVEEGRAGPLMARPRGETYSQLEQERKEGGERDKEREAGPPPQFGLGLGGRAPTLAASSSLPLRPIKAHVLPGGSRNPPVLW